MHERSFVDIIGTKYIFSILLKDSISGTCCQLGTYCYLNHGFIQHHELLCTSNKIEKNIYDAMLSDKLLEFLDISVVLCQNINISSVFCMYQKKHIQNFHQMLGMIFTTSLFCGHTPGISFSKNFLIFFCECINLPFQLQFCLEKSAPILNLTINMGSLCYENNIVDNFYLIQLAGCNLFKRKNSQDMSLMFLQSVRIKKHQDVGLLNQQVSVCKQVKVYNFMLVQKKKK
eukprot:TRINITY_DN3893_c0_g1_i8.p3 TRINITY_DN3893_c0_g1~~TRINITY_DN3893_c0_g1_i8.p3  ORF type:complete len:230 (+),score=1.75 TRINITY_DN3893_c0_g1_i8:940-1629(+)